MAHPIKMDVLWVQWLAVDKKHKAGWKAKRLYKVQFLPNLDKGTFGFLDPDDVIRSVHLIPGFDEGLVEGDPGTPMSEWDQKAAQNWSSYYVNQ